MVWYSLLFQNFPQFAVIHTVKGFGVVNKAEIDVFLELSGFFSDPTIEPPELTEDWETESWRPQTEPCVCQDPGARSSDPTGD